MVCHRGVLPGRFLYCAGNICVDAILHYVTSVICITEQVDVLSPKNHQVTNKCIAIIMITACTCNMSKY